MHPLRIEGHAEKIPLAAGALEAVPQELSKPHRAERCRQALERGQSRLDLSDGVGLVGEEVTEDQLALNIDQRLRVVVLHEALSRLHDARFIVDEVDP